MKSGATPSLQMIQLNTASQRRGHFGPRSALTSPLPIARLLRKNSFSISSAIKPRWRHHAIREGRPPAFHETAGFSRK
jgi:hypothetical protein